MSGALAAASLTHARVHLSFTITDEGSKPPNQCDPESAARNSRENPVVASEDEAGRRRTRKFFYCQTSRLRVRAKPFQAPLKRHDDITDALTVECVSTKATGAQAIPAPCHPVVCDFGALSATS